MLIIFVEAKVKMPYLRCAKNLVDSEVLIGGLKTENYNLVENPIDSDIIIVNTCGFLDVAREQSIDTILECSKLKKEGKVKNQSNLCPSYILKPE